MTNPLSNERDPVLSFDVAHTLLGPFKGISDVHQAEICRTDGSPIYSNASPFLQHINCVDQGQFAVRVLCQAAGSDPIPYTFLLDLLLYIPRSWQCVCLLDLLSATQAFSPSPFLSAALLLR